MSLFSSILILICSFSVIAQSGLDQLEDYSCEIEKQKNAEALKDMFSAQSLEEISSTLPKHIQKIDKEKLKALKKIENQNKPIGLRIADDLLDHVVKKASPTFHGKFFTEELIGHKPNSTEKSIMDMNIEAINDGQTSDMLYSYWPATSYVIPSENLDPKVSVEFNPNLIQFHISSTLTAEQIIKKANELYKTDNFKLIKKFEDIKSLSFKIERDIKSGISLNIIKIKRKGYEEEIPFEQFMEKYSGLDCSGSKNLKPKYISDIDRSFNSDVLEIKMNTFPSDNTRVNKSLVIGQ